MDRRSIDWDTGYPVHIPSASVAAPKGARSDVTVMVAALKEEPTSREESEWLRVVLVGYVETLTV